MAGDVDEDGEDVSDEESLRDDDEIKRRRKVGPRVKASERRPWMAYMSIRDRPGGTRKGRGGRGGGTKGNYATLCSIGILSNKYF